MTVEDVKAAVKQIRERCGEDYESAHGMEDLLYKNVLRAIARGKAEDPKKLAAEALKTRNIKFPRHCA